LNMLDSFKHKGLRRKLVETLRQKGITHPEVLNAIGKIPRHWFLDSAIAEHAYQDKAMPISAGQTISQPFTVAYQTQLLEPQKGLRVLEVGTGSGYQGSVLCEMGCLLYSIERIQELSDNAQKMFELLNYHPKLKVGDGSLGWPEEAPFDRIIVTAAAPKISQSLFSQLKKGGIMVIPVGNKVQTMYRVKKLGDGKAHTEAFEQFRFVPLIGSDGFSS